MIRYALESRERVLEEIKPLLERHWDEVTFYRDIPLDPDWAKYESIDRAGKLHVFTARLDEALIGYCVAMVSWGAHYKTCLVVDEDLLFLAPDHRKGRLGVGLIQYVDEYFRSWLPTMPNCQLIARRHVKVRPDLDYGKLLEHLGYECMERIYVKRLDVSGV